MRPFSVIRSLPLHPSRAIIVPPTAQWLPIHALRTIRPVSTTPPLPLLNKPPPPDFHKPNRRFIFASAVTAAVFSAFALSQLNPSPSAESPSLPLERHFRLDEIRSHNSTSPSQWVYRGDRVYDITSWIPNHPGGEVILRAVGGNIDPYWQMFTIHQSPDVSSILEQYFIGKIDPRDLIDGSPPSSLCDSDDPFTLDPCRDPALTCHTPRPYNAEPPAPSLSTSFLTPNPLFYIRNHFWVPSVPDAPSWQITIDLPSGDEAVYTLADLRTKFAQHTITATLQCSGNRRSHMSSSVSPTSGLPWSVGAISTAEWTGVLLRDVLAHAGFDVTGQSEEAASVRHVHLAGEEAYAASIPIEKACDVRGDVLLAHTMNGEEIPRDHGFPVRVLVPGTVAARSVKWLRRVSLAQEESGSQWQRRDYKCFGPNEGKKPDWDRAVSIQETPVQSAITAVRRCNVERREGKQEAEDRVVLEGYAFSGGGRKIVRVDVSVDDGKTWRQAELVRHEEEEKGSRAWCWQLWTLAVPEGRVKGGFCVKAVDDGYNTQPETFDPIYNFRGNLANSWHRVPVQFDSEVETGAVPQKKCGSIMTEHVEA